MLSPAHSSPRLTDPFDRKHKCPFCGSLETESMDKAVHSPEEKVNFLCHDCRKSFRIQTETERKTAEKKEKSASQRCPTCGKFLSVSPFRWVKWAEWIAIPASLISLVFVKPSDALLILFGAFVAFEIVKLFLIHREKICRSCDSPFVTRREIGGRLGIAAVMVIALAAVTVLFRGPDWSWGRYIDDQLRSAQGMADAELPTTPEGYIEEITRLRSYLQDVQKDAETIMTLAEQGRSMVGVIEKYRAQLLDSSDNQQVLDFIEQAHQTIDFYDHHAKEFMSYGPATIEHLSVLLEKIQEEKDDMVVFRSNEAKYAWLVASGRSMYDTVESSEITMRQARLDMEKEIVLLDALAKSKVPNYHFNIN